MIQPCCTIYLLHEVSVPFSHVIDYLGISVMCNLEIFKGTEPVLRCYLLLLFQSVHLRKYLH